MSLRRQNPYNHIIYRGLHRPGRVGVDGLFPSEQHTNNDVTVIRPIWRALSQHSGPLALILPSLQPNIGDFILVDHTDDSFFAVEIKRSGYSSPDWHKGSVRLTLSFNIRYYYTPWAAWDFILLYSSESDQHDALLLARDELPEDLVRGPAKGVYTYLWSPGADYLRKCRLPAPSNPKYAQQFSKIVRSLRKTGKIPSKRTPPMDRAWCKNIHDGGGEPMSATILDDRKKKVVPSQPQSSDPGLVRGDGQRESRMLREAHVEMMLEEQCEKM